MQTSKRIAKVVTANNREDMMQFVTGVNTEVSFIQIRTDQVIFFLKAGSSGYFVGILLLLLKKLFVRLLSTSREWIQCCICLSDASHGNNILFHVYIHASIKAK